jgi:hypothetical protein
MNEFKQRITGEVAAPCIRSRVEQTPSDVAEHIASFGARAGRAAERAAVVKYLRKRAESCADAFWRDAVNNWALVIEHGEHL